MKKIRIGLMLVLCALVTFACEDDEDPPAKVELLSFDIMLDNAYSIPMVTGRSETGNIQMSLYDDKSLSFTITINGLMASDDLTVAHVHTGDVVTAGSVAITLVDGSNIAFSGNTATGTVSLTDEQITTLQGDDVYVNVHSTDQPSGLVRGQIDQTIDNAYNVSLSPANEIPAINDRNETGQAYIRIVGSTMFYKVIVNDLEASDAITAGHIHEGSATVNGGVLVNLGITGSAELEQTKNLTLSTEELGKINNDELYVNIHSTQYPGGLLRGQIR
ncbi:CHRD domain-containing protein [Cyclobacterium sp. 1_MG-2023]|uniref:CHRD domain-containing protein n=1 Tax=Cyclobacterium sp. 1_MG-2023 TaxID=3062681 RepID=UPI0026E1E7A7|nr:CHRD domain-containing protein [Cyclobacterium sp. 1_MG-2023]MDO6439098.1 CHRD domain-containing protein [Cyclobacterium sp. 1_MG-2023]|eukprot:TRINITY_DN35708_c0_g1_i1.p1 TRINITY_DN35708_c0_g1~~TRINITY_DN35708_c0_g1_i1.p1  ORF type:complete len:275 (-),score=4.49 TRINITY_DN35708_c0_g1_i1:29-853(-)